MKKMLQLDLFKGLLVRLICLFTDW